MKTKHTFTWNTWKPNTPLPGVHEHQTHLYLEYMNTKHTFTWNTPNTSKQIHRLKNKQAVVLKHNKPHPRVAHRGIAHFLGIEQKCNQVIPWSLHTFPENFMQIGPAIFS